MADQLTITLNACRELRDMKGSACSLPGQNPKARLIERLTMTSRALQYII